MSNQDAGWRNDVAPLGSLRKPRKSRRVWWIVAGVAVVVVVAAVAAGGGKKKTSTNGTAALAPAPGAQSVQAAGSRPATADVTIQSCANDPAGVGGKPVVVVTNHSSKTSNYVITVAVDSADGKTQIDTANATVQNLQPGQSATVDAYAQQSIPAGAVCRVAQVDRYASA